MNTKELLKELGIEGSLAEVHKELNARIQEIDWKLLGDELRFCPMYVKADMLFSIEKNNLMEYIGCQKN